MRTWFTAMLLVAFALFTSPAFSQDAQPGDAPSPMPTPVCKPGDTVVWANHRTMKYRLPGDPAFGQTKRGRYMCQSDADAAGYRMTKASKQQPGSMPPEPEPEPTGT